MEEEKDGIKGPPTPTITYYAKSDFFVEGPMNEDTGQGGQQEDEFSLFGEQYADDLPQAGGEDYWWLEDEAEKPAEEENLFKESSESDSWNW